MVARYAVYYAPPEDGALWAFGSAVVGYDAALGVDLLAPDLAGFDGEAWHALTEEPRRYGFHGTLKPPFRLAEGVGEGDLLAAVETLAAGHHGFELPPLVVCEIGNFIALVPSAPAPALTDLADRLVVELDPFRAQLTPEEVARRRPERLSARQRAYLDRHGYPYVLEEFRFHMTLSGPLEEEQRAHALNALRDAFVACGAGLPPRVEDVALFRQDVPGARFRIVARLPLSGA